VAKTGLFANGFARTGWGKVDRWLTRLTGADLRRANAVAMLRHLTWLIERQKESPDGLRKHTAEWAALRGQLPRGVMYEMGNLSRYADDLGDKEAEFRCAAVALAAEQFRRANGRWPTTLGELVSQHLTVVPSDPFDLQPLKLAARPDGIVIYSVGVDGKDDGGDVRGGQHRGLDIGVRLWNVNLRRQPPLPKTAAADKNL
jgi:hypothetical protein